MRGYRTDRGVPGSPRHPLVTMPLFSSLVVTLSWLPLTVFSVAGVFFDTRVEDVQFVDFCGMYHIPLMRYLCSSHCERQQTAEGALRSDESDSDDEVGWRQRRLRRVLLG